MDRELIFRAWHKPSKTMYWFDIMNGNAHGTGAGYISMAPFGESITKYRHKDNVIAVDPQDCEIMQFTGLHDKNGKEIYEGDIANTIMSGLIRYEFKSKVVFKNGCFGIEGLEDLVLINNAVGSFKSFDGCKTTDLIEIIGNIHENPELLNSKEVTNG